MKRAAIPLVGVLVTGCCCFMFQGDPYYYQYTRAEPDASDLVGLYTPKAESVEFVKGKGFDFTSVAIWLKDDGSFIVEGVPPGDYYLANNTGKWSIEKQQEWWVVGIATESDVESRGKMQHWESHGNIHLIGEKPPYLLHITVGDPDSGECIEFERKQEN